MFRPDSQELEWKVVNDANWKYEGQVKKGTGTREGYGTLIFNDGKRQRGYFKNNIIHGYVTVIYSNGNKYAG